MIMTICQSLFKSNDVYKTDATVTQATEFSTNEYQRDYFNSDTENSTKFQFVSFVALMFSLYLV